MWCVGGVATRGEMARKLRYPTGGMYSAMTPHGSALIPEIPFVNRRTPRMGCELISLRRLFARRLDHALDAPQRAEHWDVMQAIPATMPNPHGMF